MFEVNIYSAPPTADQLRKQRGNGAFEDSAAFKVLMFTPIPGVDLLAAMATYAVEATVCGKDFEPVKGAVKMDWSESTFTRTYVEKVGAQGRELVGVEVDALNRHLTFERSARAVASALADVAMERGTVALNGAATAVGEAFASGIKNLFASNPKN